MSVVKSKVTPTSALTNNTEKISLKNKPNYLNPSLKYPKGIFEKQSANKNKMKQHIHKATFPEWGLRTYTCIHPCTIAESSISEDKLGKRLPPLGRV